MLGKIEGRRRRWLQRMNTNSTDMSFSKLWGLVMDREAWHAVCSPWGCKETRLNWTGPGWNVTCSSSLWENFPLCLLFFSCWLVTYSLWHHGLQHARLPCTSLSPRVCANSCPLNQWCHPTVSSSVVPFSSCPQCFPASGSFQMSQFFTDGQIIGFSASTSVLPMNTQDWSAFGWTGWVYLWSKGLSTVFSNITIQKHQFFSAKLCLWSNSHTHTWLLETIALTRQTFIDNVSAF